MGFMLFENNRLSAQGLGCTWEAGTRIRFRRRRLTDLGEEKKKKGKRKEEKEKVEEEEEEEEAKEAEDIYARRDLGKGD